MIKIHHLGVSQSDRIVWLCEELGVPYELLHYQRDPQTQLAPPAYRALHPYGTAPVITDGDRVLGESGAIVEYINARYGNSRLSVPKDSPHFADYLYWLHFANASLMASGMVELVCSLVKAPRDNPVIQSLVQRTDRAYDMIEQHLGHHPYFAGPQFSAADILMLFPLSTMRAFVPRNLAGYPNLRAYLKRIGERPAFQAAARKADPNFKPILE
jgi:glutathione S-transferase